MTEQELLQVRGLVEAIRNDARLTGEQWQSLTYRGERPVSLRRFKYYDENLRISGEKIDFYLYIGLSDDLAVFQGLVERLPGLAQDLRTRYPTIKITYKTEPARYPETQVLKGSMTLAHFYIPLGCTEMLKDAYVKVYEMSRNIAKGAEVMPTGPQKRKENG